MVTHYGWAGGFWDLLPARFWRYGVVDPDFGPNETCATMVDHPCAALSARVVLGPAGFPDAASMTLRLEKSVDDGATWTTLSADLVLDAPAAAFAAMVFVLLPGEVALAYGDQVRAVAAGVVGAGVDMGVHRWMFELLTS